MLWELWLWGEQEVVSSQMKAGRHVGASLCTDCIDEVIPLHYSKGNRAYLTAETAAIYEPWRSTTKSPGELQLSYTYEVPCLHTARPFSFMGTDGMFEHTIRNRRPSRLFMPHTSMGLGSWTGLLSTSNRDVIGRWLTFDTGTQRGRRSIMCGANKIR